MNAATGKPSLRGQRPVVSRGRLARARVIAFATRVLAAFFRLVPWRAAQALGRPLGRLAWSLSRRDRYRMMEHLAIAFPERGEEELEALCKACYAHLATTAAEILWLFTRDCRAVLRHTETVGLERVLALRDSGRPILFITGHCGNWELLAARLNCSGLGMTVVVRALDEAPLQRLVESFRRRFGTEAVQRGQAGAARVLLRSLREGALGMLIDQDTRVDGVWVPFFGRPAYTPVGAARLALRRDAAVIPIFIERRSDGSHLARFEPPLDLPDDEMEATALMTRAIEEQIRRVPEQWVWMHRRWRRQPA